MEEKKEMKFSEGFAIFVIIVIAILITFNAIYNYYLKSKDDSFMFINRMNRPYSVEVDTINPENYIISDTSAIPDKQKTSQSKIFYHLIQTKDGTQYVYNQEDLLCYFFPPDYGINKGTIKENAYQEIRNNKLVIYTQDKVGIRTGVVTKYYKDKECSNIYMVKK